MPIVENVNYAECDGNGCPVSEKMQGKELPAGWIRIQVADVGDISRQPAFVLHSLKCVERWAKGRRALEIQGERARAYRPDRTSQNGGGEDIALSASQRLGLSIPEIAEFNRRLILDCFQQTPSDEFTVEDLATFAEVHTTTVRKYLDTLLADGVIEVSYQGTGGPGNASKYRLLVKAEV